MWEAPVEVPTDSLANGVAHAPTPAVSTLVIDVSTLAAVDQEEPVGENSEELLRCKRELEAVLEELEREP
jgi:hypothetical protein